MLVGEQIEHILVSLGVAKSMAEATRKIKEKAVKYRDLFCHGDWISAESRQILPPDYYLLRIGKQTYHSHVQCFVIPAKKQTLKGTEKFLREDGYLDIH